jgi:hypothetical protein
MAAAIARVREDRAIGLTMLEAVDEAARYFHVAVDALRAAYIADLAARGWR